MKSHTLTSALFLASYLLLVPAIPVSSQNFMSTWPTKRLGTRSPMISRSGLAYRNSPLLMVHKPANAFCRARPTYHNAQSAARLVPATAVVP